MNVQLNKYETDTYFLQIFQSDTSVWLIISVFCKICELKTEHESEPEIVLKVLQLTFRLTPLTSAAIFLEQFQVHFHVQCSVLKSYKTRE